MANVRPFRALRKLSVEERARALGRLEAGIHPENVANQSSVHHSTSFRLRQRHLTTGTVSDRPRSGQPKCMTQREDQYIAVTVARQWFVDGPSLERMLRQQRGPGSRPISVQTVRNRVRTSGLRQENRLGSSSSPNATELQCASFAHAMADGIGNNGRTSFSLTNPCFVCERSTVASEFGVETARDT